MSLAGCYTDQSWGNELPGGLQIRDIFAEFPQLTTMLVGVFILREERRPCGLIAHLAEERSDDGYRGGIVDGLSARIGGDDV